MVKAIYQDLSLDLERYIRDNNISGRMPGVLRLSRELKVHHVTLSKAIRLLERKGIVEVKGTKGTFVVEHTSRPRTNVIGVVGIRNDDNILNTLNDFVHLRGYDIIGINFQEKLFKTNKRVLLNFPVDGFVFRMSALRNEQLQIFQKQNIPITSCNYINGCSWLNMGVFDHCHGYNMLLDRLIAMGHSRIAYVDFNRSSEYSYFINDIRNVFIDKLKHNFSEELFHSEITQLEALNIYGDDYLREYGKKILKKLFSCNIRPSIIVGPDGLISKMRAELEKSNIKVPDDVSLCGIGYDERNMFDYLSGIRHSEIKLLKWALNNVINQIEGKQKEVELYWHKASWHEGQSVNKVETKTIKK